MILFHFHIWIVIFLGLGKELGFFVQGEKNLQIEKGKKVYLKKANIIDESCSTSSLICR